MSHPLDGAKLRVAQAEEHPAARNMKNAPRMRKNWRMAGPPVNRPLLRVY